MAGNPFVNNSNFMGGINMNNLRNMYQLFMNSKNPTQMIMNMARQNPQFRPIAQALQSGQNPQQIFNQMCQQRGIDPNEFIKNVTGNNT